MRLIKEEDRELNNSVLIWIFESDDELLLAKQSLILIRLRIALCAFSRETSHNKERVLQGITFGALSHPDLAARSPTGPMSLPLMGRRSVPSFRIIEDRYLTTSRVVKASNPAIQQFDLDIYGLFVRQLSNPTEI